MKLASARIVSAMMVMPALLGFVAVFRVDVVKADASVLLFVDPQNNIFSSAPVGTTFLVNVTVANITNLAGVQFTLSWNPTLLKCNSLIDVFYHDPLITNSTDIPGNIEQLKLAKDNVAGTANYAFTWLDMGLAQADGNAPANITTTGSAVGNPTYPWPEGKHGCATFNFTVLSQPNSTAPSLSCALHMSNAILGDINALPIAHTDVDGLYQNSFPVPTVSKPYFSMATQGSGASGVNYTAHSVGETFNVTVILSNLTADFEAVKFGFKLGYNATMLNVLNVYEGPWLLPFGSSPNQGTSFTTAFGFNGTIGQNYTQVEDSVRPDANGTWHSPFPSGSGVVAIIMFNCTLQNGVSGPNLVCPLTLFDAVVTNTTAGVVPQSMAPVSGTYTMKHKSIPGDLNHDGKVDIEDAIILANAFGSSPGSSNWNSEADLNGDGTINILDMILLAGNFGGHA